MHHLHHSDAESPRIARRIPCDPRHTVAQIRLFATLKAAFNHGARTTKLAMTQRPLRPSGHPRRHSPSRHRQTRPDSADDHEW